MTIVGTDGGLEGGYVELPTGALEGLHVHAGEGGGAARFEMDRVRRLVREHLLARPAMHAQGDLVAHRARRQEEGRLFAEKVRDHLLQEIDGGVLVFLLVPHLRLAHEAAHLGGGPGHGIAVEIDLDRHGHLLVHGQAADLQSVGADLVEHGRILL